MSVDFQAIWLLRGVAACAVSVLSVSGTSATIENRVAIKNEQLGDVDQIIRCSAFFQTIAPFRGRAADRVEVLNQAADRMLERAIEYRVEEDPTASESIAAEATVERDSLGEAYQTMLREEFGTAKRRTFATYDLLIMQEDLKFCLDIFDDQGLEVDRPLPVR